MAELNLKQIIDRLNEEFTGDTRKLAAGAVDRIGPHQHKHTDNMDGQTVEIKENACTDTEKDGGHSNGVGRDSEPACQQRPPVAERTIKMQIEPLFGIH